MKTRSMMCALAAAGLQFAAPAWSQGNFNVENNTVPQEWTNRAKDGAPAQSKAEVEYRDRQAAIRDPRPAERRQWDNRGRLPDYPRGDRPGGVRERPGHWDGPTPVERDHRPGGVRDRPGYWDGPTPVEHDHRPGSRVPAPQRGYGYVVDDWRGHRLSPPPRGHQWVQSGADYLLVNSRTGTVERVVRGH